MSPPKVSVIIPAFNAENFLQQAVESVLKQTLDSLEVIIIDDCSTDATLAIAAALAGQDSRVRYCQSSANRGPGHARNLGIDLSCGEWVTFLDADDWYDPERVEKLLQTTEAMQLNIGVDNQRFVTSTDHFPQRLLISGKKAISSRLSIIDYFNGDRIKRNSANFGLFKPMIRRSFLIEHHLKYDERERSTTGEDFYFLLQCLKYGKQMALRTEPLYNYRIDNEFALTKRQTVASYIDSKNMHNRYLAMFDAIKEPTEYKLMIARGKDIDRHIQFRMLAEPLKQGRFFTACKQAIREPECLRVLISEFVDDPRAFWLLLSHLWRRAAKRPMRISLQ